MQRFELGQVVMTPGAATRVPMARMLACLRQFWSTDWGVMDVEDYRANDAALIDGDRLMGVYPIDPEQPCKGNNRLWIITEASREITTFLLPDEY